MDKAARVHQQIPNQGAVWDRPGVVGAASGVVSEAAGMSEGHSSLYPPIVSTRVLSRRQPAGPHSESQRGVGDARKPS